MLTKGVTIEKLKLCVASIGFLAWERDDELLRWGIVFGGVQLMLVIELVSKWEICWAFVEPNCIWYVDIGKLPNHVNTILCVWLFFFCVCFLYFISHMFENFELIPFNLCKVYLTYLFSLQRKEILNTEQ